MDTPSTFQTNSDKIPVQRGVKIKLQPTPEQRATMDSWRRRGRCLWNLLLAIEQAAYSGEKFRPELKWREIWLEIAREEYAVRLERRAEKIAIIETATAALASCNENEAKIKKTIANFLLNKRTAWVGKMFTQKGMKDLTGVKYRKKYEKQLEKLIELAQKEETPPDPDKILGTHPQPKLFIWDSELAKIMARLKKNPLTEWIGELPSHSAQQVCKDICKALSAVSQSEFGFPRFKKARYAEGSVYMVNTLTVFDRENRTLTLPKIKGAIQYRQEHPLEGRLLGGRIWRQGETWWLSCQFETEIKPLPRTGREAGLKIAASKICTTWDGDTITQFATPQEDKKLIRRIKLANRRLARRHKGTKDYYETNDELARLHAKERDRRDDRLHKISCWVAHAFDVVTVHDTKVAPLMEKECKKADGKTEKTPRTLIKTNKRAAMSRFRGFVTYKMTDGGKTVNETHTLFPEVQKCSGCGKLHFMPLDKRVLNCQCGTCIERGVNAAINEFEQGQLVAKATKL